MSIDGHRYSSGQISGPARRTTSGPLTPGRRPLALVRTGARTARAPPPPQGAVGGGVKDSVARVGRWAGPGLLGAERRGGVADRGGVRGPGRLAGPPRGPARLGARPPAGGPRAPGRGRRRVRPASEGAGLPGVVHGGVRVGARRLAGRTDGVSDHCGIPCSCGATTVRDGGGRRHRLPDVTGLRRPAPLPRATPASAAGRHTTARGAGGSTRARCVRTGPVSSCASSGRPAHRTRGTHRPSAWPSVPC